MPILRKAKAENTLYQGEILILTKKILSYSDFCWNKANKTNLELASDTFINSNHFKSMQMMLKGVGIVQNRL